MYRLGARRRPVYVRHFSQKLGVRNSIITIISSHIPKAPKVCHLERIEADCQKGSHAAGNAATAAAAVAQCCTES
ncbi:hypothetical protein TYRP_018345 [Tyrophagus putrescentiae]|nr:hypothetical protein TYRP_018345 [Tyrophagus putrescentiae]